MHRSRRQRAVLPLVLLIGLLAAACSSAATPAPTVAPTAAPAVTPAATAAPPATAAPTPVATPASAQFPLALTDDEGTTSTLEARPERIVSLTPATTETLFAVGAGSRVVGRTDADDYPAAAASIQTVVTFGKVDVEKIVALRPDLVLAGGNFLTPPDVVVKLRSLGLTVLVVYAPDVAGVLRDIEIVASAAGEEAAGRRITAAMTARIDEITAAVGSAASRPRVFYEIDATKEIYGPADRSFVASMIELAGGAPITTGSPTVWSLPLEKLVIANPEVILLGDAAFGTAPEQVKARAGWATMAAVRTGAIRPVNDTLVTRPGPRLAEGLASLALAINPDLAVPPPAASPGDGY